MSDLLNKSPLDGVIVECGVGIGFSLSILAKISKKKIFAFDSFTGFPEKISKNDVSENDTVDMLKILKFSKKHYKLMSIDLVKRNLLNNGINEKDIENKIIFKKGFYPESFKNFDEKISFLHLDVDLYDSYKHCLNYFFPKVISGGIIAFDEYVDKNESNSKKGYNWYGSKIAIDEFVESNNLSLKEHPEGYKYIIKN